MSNQICCSNCIYYANNTNKNYGTCMNHNKYIMEGKKNNIKIIPYIIESDYEASECKYFKENPPVKYVDYIK